MPISKPIASGCASDAECVSGQHCELTSGICRECTSNAHCPTEWTCDRGTCLDQRAECTYDGMCRPPATVCADQRCVPGCSAEDSPIVCGGNTICDAPTGRCMAMDGCRIDFDCSPPSSICVDGGVCAPGCTGTGCPAGDHCNDATGRCEPESVGQTCAEDRNCAPPTTVCDALECKPGCGHPNGITCSSVEICDAASGRCIPTPSCFTDSECPSLAPICESGFCAPGCDQAGGSCGAGSVCNTATGRCEGQGCGVCSAPTPICNTQLGVCAACAAASDCTSTYPVCDASSGTCRGCAASSECGSATPVCHLPSGVCVGCVSNADCSGNTPVCEISSGSCRGCTQNGECGGGTVCHQPSGLCLECVTNADCPSSEPTCDAATGTCVLLPPQPLGSPCGSDLECLSEVCWDVGSGGRCIRSCNQPADCDNGTTCHMLYGARMCLDPQTAPAAAEDVECTINSDCTTPGTLCAWVEDSPGHFDQRCRAPIGSGQPQSQCNGGNQCQNGVCTVAINQSGALCRYTCATDDECPSNFACLYIDYEGQSYVQAVKACLPVASPSPAVCGVDLDCDTDEVCAIYDDGVTGGLQYWSNACAPR